MCGASFCDIVAGDSPVLEDYMNKKDLAERKARAEKLAVQLKKKMELYFPEPPENTRIAEMIALRTEIEKLGFIVTWDADVNTQTLACTVTITLLETKKH